MEELWDNEDYLQAYKEAALEAANIARHAMGLEPVTELYAGRPQDAYSCAITATVIDDDVDTEKFLISTHPFRITVAGPGVWEQIALDVKARGFIRAFDAGRYPDLRIKWIKDLPERVKKNRKRGNG
jgi:hypothetical protein